MKVEGSKKKFTEKLNSGIFTAQPFQYHRNIVDKQLKYPMDIIHYVELE